MLEFSEYMSSSLFAAHLGSRAREQGVNTYQSVSVAAAPSSYQCTIRTYFSKVGGGGSLTGYCVRIMLERLITYYYYNYQIQFRNHELSGQVNHWYWKLLIVTHEYHVVS